LRVAKVTKRLDAALTYRCWLVPQASLNRIKNSDTLIGPDLSQGTIRVRGKNNFVSHLSKG
jgi:hypothetical protein